MHFVTASFSGGRFFGLSFCICFHFVVFVIVISTFKNK
ncbi:putative membrane protein [Escherichia coli 1-176-05_S3_C2]|nr:putative membrane protein [Escherichia coli 1-176-05_S3_C2]